MNFYLLLILTFYYIHTEAQNKEIFFSTKRDSLAHEFKESVRHKLQIKLDINTDVKTMNFQRDKGANEIILAPNQTTNLRLSINYKFLGIAYSVSPNFLFGNNDNEEKGESKTQGFVMNINFPRFQQRLYYTTTQGYYVKNTSDYPVAMTRGVSYIKFPEFKYR